MVAPIHFIILILALVFSSVPHVHAFVSPSSCSVVNRMQRTRSTLQAVTSEEEETEAASTPASVPPRQASMSTDPAFLSQETAGGFTVKQRLREEVESPFRKVRLLFFGGSTGSALTALYFSMLNTVKAYVGGYSDAPPLDEALTSDAINIGAAIVCALLAYRDYQAGQANLERIAQGGRLAALPLELPSDGKRIVRQVKDYRRFSRVVLAVGGQNYVSKLARTLTADQLQDKNTFPEQLEGTDVLVVPVLLDEISSKSRPVLGDSQSFWSSIEPSDESDRNMDISRADRIVAYPLGKTQWEEYLGPELTTAVGQGFDVMEQGVHIIVKKNGRILRRATGIPPWGDLIATLEVADGSRFGMPGDSEKYGGR